MSRFDDLGSAYLGPALTEFAGELVTVHPQGSPAYQVRAIVNRDDPRLTGAQPGGSPTAYASMDVRDHATEGIAINSLQRGKHEMEFAIERPGGTPARHTVMHFGDPVGGLITLYFG